MPPARIRTRGVGGMLRRWSAKTRHVLWSTVGVLVFATVIYGPRAAVQGCRGPGPAEQGRRARQAAYDNAVKPYRQRCPNSAETCLAIDVEELSWPGAVGAHFGADHPRFAAVIDGLRFSRKRMVSFRATVDEVADLITEFQIPSPASSLLTGLRRDAVVTVYLEGTPDLAQLVEHGDRPLTIVFIDPGFVGPNSLSHR